MARHRRSMGAGPGVPAPTAAGPRNSHRRPGGAARGRTVSLLTAGALAGGAAIAAATIPWSHTAPLPPNHPSSNHPSPDDRAGAPPTRPAGAAPTPEHAGPALDASGVAPHEGASAASGSSSPRTPAVRPPARTSSTRWRAHDQQAFRPTRSSSTGSTAPQVVHGDVTFHLAPGVRRCELEPALPALGEGDEHLVVVSVRLDHSSSGAAAGEQVIMRWDNDGPGSAPVDLRVRDGRLVLHGGDGHPSGARTFTRDLGHAPVGEWAHLSVRARFSANPEKGRISVRRDGHTVLADHRPPGGTLYPGQQSHLTAGLRRESATAHPAGVRLRDWHVSGVRSSGTHSSGTHSSGTHSSGTTHGSEAHTHAGTSTHGSTGRHARSSEAHHDRR